MGDVVPFPARRVCTADLHPAPPLLLEARRGSVVLLIEETELWFDPAQALELGRDLLELADEAEGCRG